MFSINPTAQSITSRLLFPYDTNGSGTPVSGASPMTANRFTTAWVRTSAVSPVASSLP